MLQTLVAEVYGPDYKGQIELAAQVKRVFQQTPGVVDVDWYVEDPQTKYDMKVDLDKAALHGISPALSTLLLPMRPFHQVFPYIKSPRFDDLVSGMARFS